MNEDAILQSSVSNSKGVLNYETVVNMHIMRSNQLMQTLVSQKGVDIPVMMSLYSTVIGLDGLIRNDRQAEGYDENMDQRLEKIRQSFKKLGDNSQDDMKFINIWFDILDTYNYQLRQMNKLGLTPERDITEVWGKIVYTDKPANPLIIEEEHRWVPKPGELDWEKEDKENADTQASISSTDQG